jgi:RHS repeat-associated protein
MSLKTNRLCSMLSLLTTERNSSKMRFNITKKSQLPLTLVIPFLIISCLLIHDSALADLSAERALMATTYKLIGNEPSQTQKGVVSQTSAQGEFYWGSAWFYPGPTAYVSSTYAVYYFISLRNTPVGDRFTWNVYRPVLDPVTYLPTDELTQFGTGTLTRSTEQYWSWFSGFSGERYDVASGDLNFGAGPFIKDSSATAYPGIWEMTISRNGALLTSGNFTLIDNLAPKVSFMSPTDGTTLKGIKYLMVSNSDNLAVTKVELYADNIITGQSYLLDTRNKPASTFAYFWDTTNHPDGDYILRALAYDPYNNIGTATVAVIVANKAAFDKKVPTYKTTQVGEPINVATGNMSMAQTDILIPFKETPLELSRTYNSQDDFSGGFGYGWRSNFDISLSEQLDQSVVEVDGDGVYTIYTSNGNGTYTPSAGKYSQLTKNPDGAFVLLRKHGRKLYFNPLGKLTKIEERNGNYLNITRLANGAISQVSDSAGRKLLFTSDIQGRITQVTDPAGRVFKYLYDAQGNLIEVTDPLRKGTIYVYDANHNLIAKTDTNGHLLHFEYDTSDRAYHSWQDGGNNEITLNFSWLNKTTTVTDSLGNITRYEYNYYGLVNKVTDAQNNAEPTVWDANFNKTSSTDKNTNTTTLSYDSRGNLVSTTDPQGKTTDFTYEPNFDFVASTTDALGGRTYYDYDAKGNLLQVTDALGNAITHTYDSSGQLIQTKDANNNATNFVYDNYGNLIGVTDALTNQNSFSYNVIGKVIQETNALGNSTSFAYDLLGRLTQVTYSDGSKTTSTYDAVGNLISFTDQARKTTDYTYDAIDRLITKIDALGNTLTNTYDTKGNLISITDPEANKTQYFYDSLDRLIKTIDPLGNQILSSYDPNGNRISKTDAKNNTITYAYDAKNRLIRTVYPDSSSVLFIYDALGRKTSIVDSSGTTLYAYDAISRITQVDGPQPNDTISYAYDKVGNRIQMTNPDGGITNYTHDALNRVSTLTDHQGLVINYAYDAVGNLINLSYPNATQAAYTFDKLNRLASLVNKKDPTVISSYNYTYNVVGMRTKVTLANGDYILYTYDKLNRLLSENRYNPRKKLLYSITYTYDPLGNRLTENTDIRDTNFKIADYPEKASLTYTYNAANQLTNLKVNVVSKGKVTVVKEISYTYDPNGNLTQQNDSQTTTNYAYDFENRLISVTNPSQNATYTYDAEGKRISQVEGGLVTKFLYDGMNVILERDNSNQRIASYTRGLNYVGGIGGIISSYDIGGTSSHYLYDGLGSVTGLTDSTGSTSKTYTYDAFGNILQQSDTAANAYQFQTKQVSSSTGLVYFGARYYNPLVGRWLTPDPMGMVDGPNLYAYLNNNPVNLADPWGLCGVKPPLWQNWGLMLQLSISAINKGASTYFGQWVNTIEEYAPGWTQGIAKATGFQNAFQALGVIQSSFGYMDIYNKAQSQNLSTEQIRAASLIRGVGMGVKLLGVTGGAAIGSAAGPWGTVAGAAIGGTAFSIWVDSKEKEIFCYIGIQ